MANQIKAHGLADFSVTGRDDERESVVIALTDTRRKTSAYVINPEALNLLLSDLLGLATQWADKPDLKIGEISGPTRALPASHVAITRGRNASEAAIRIFVGQVELSFLIPLNVLMKSLTDFVGTIGTDRGGTKH